MSSFLHALMKYANLTGFLGAKYELQISHTKSLCFKRFFISQYIFYFQVSTTKNLKVTNELQVASNPLKFKLCKHAHALHLIPKRDHSFKTSAIFHDFWPLSPYHRHSSKMLMKGIFAPSVLWPFVHRHMGTPLPP